VRADKDFVPEAAVRASQDTDYHTGRGGAGNEHVAKTGKEPAERGEGGKPVAPVGLADRLKHKIFGVFKK
jgi:hypothetical protein